MCSSDLFPGHDIYALNVLILGSLYELMVPLVVQVLLFLLYF